MRVKTADGYRTRCAFSPRSATPTALMA